MITIAIMDSFVSSRKNKGIALKEDNMITDKFSRIFQVLYIKIQALKANSHCTD